MIKSFLNNYFGFTKQQRNGLFVLVLISLLLLIVRVVYPLFIKPDPIVLLDLPLIERKLDSTYTASEKFSKKNPDYRDKKENSNSLHLFVFDPNTVSLEQLRLLGLKEKTAQIFLKFRDKGFVFKEKKDLQKVYGISGNLYAQLEPYILISESKHIKKEISEKTQAVEKSYPAGIPAASVKPPVSKVELNAADSLSLMSINGIGRSYSKRILKYRAMLGGFVSVEQLKEVYGLSEEVYEKIKNNVTVDQKAIQTLNLNKDEFKVLNKHPYLTYEITRSIFDWRRKTSINSSNLKDILNDPSIYQKLLPYLVFD